MKRNISDFFRRGLISCGFGPLVLAIVYLILQSQCHLQTLTVREVCVGIVSLSALAFIAGGLNVLYGIERLPLMAAILIHGSVTPHTSRTVLSFCTLVIVLQMP